MLTDLELQRFSRQLLLPGFELEHQEKLGESRVLIVGCGGLGSPVAMLLAAAGVGYLGLVDEDAVDLSNLHRQLLHGDDDIGRPKVESASDFIAKQYPHCEVAVFNQRLTVDNASSLAQGYDLIIDATDNYGARFLLNTVCLEKQIPWVSAAAVRSEGQLISFNPLKPGPCYRCLYPDAGSDSALSCRESGVLGPVVTTLGALQALEAIKLLTGWGEPLGGKLLVLDLFNYSQQLIEIPRKNDCPACGL